ncbi:MAG: peptidylprolyl isomerase, partial [Brevundimonas sp.]
MTLMFAAAAAALLLAGTATAQDAGGPPPPPPPTPGTTITQTDWRTVAPENLLVIDTTKGRVLIELTPQIAPLHVERVRLLARNGFFDGLLWHRVIDWFMAQTG